MLRQQVTCILENYYLQVVSLQTIMIHIIPHLAILVNK